MFSKVTTQRERTSTTAKPMTTTRTALVEAFPALVAGAALAIAALSGPPKRARSGTAEAPSRNPPTANVS